MGKDLIKEAILNIYETKDIGAIQNLIDLLKGSNVIVPTSYKVGEKDLENFFKCKEGETLKLESDIMFNFNYIENENHEVFLPIFSSFDEINDDVSTIQIYIDNLLEYLYYKEGIEGIVINPFTTPVKFVKEQFNYFLTLSDEEILIYFHDKYKGDHKKMDKALQKDNPFIAMEVRKRVNELKLKYDIYTCLDEKNKDLFENNDELCIYKEKGEGLVFYKYGDVLDSNVDIILHQVNLEGYMGAGIAHQIANMYPFVEKEYIDYSNKNLGEVLFSKTDNYVIGNCFSQDRDFNTDYNALKECLTKVNKYMDENSFKTLAIPYNYGCGITNGDWEKVEKIFKEQFADKNLFIIKYNK